MQKRHAEAIVQAAKKHNVNIKCDMEYAPLMERNETCCAIIGRMYDVVTAHAYACYEAGATGAPDNHLCEALRNVDNIDKNGTVAVYS